MTSLHRPASARVRFLASVTSEAEAHSALAAGADIIDCKDPSSGALGALDPAMVRAIRNGPAREAEVSATIGDMPCDPETVAQAVTVMAAAGVDYVKVGLYPDGDACSTLRCLGALDLGACRLVGVLIADRAPDFSLIREAGQAGFAGVMLDTVEKANGSLTDYVGPAQLSCFVAEAHAAGLFVGLAGALRVHHIPGLVALGPDVLGFRGALCRGESRTGGLDRAAVSAVRGALDTAMNAVSVAAREARFA